MKISLIIPTYGETDFGQTLYDAMNQTLQPDEVIVANSGSHRVIENNHGGYIREIFVCNPTAGKARNAAIDAARNEIIIGVDSGCFVEKDFFKNMVDTLLKHEDAIVWCNHQPLADSVFEECSNMVFSGKLSEILNRKKILKVFAQTRGFAIRKTTFIKAGGFPEWLVTGEDVLFSRKLAEMGIHSVICDKAVLRWKPRNNFQDTARQYFQYGRGDGHSTNHRIIQGTKISIYSSIIFFTAIKKWRWAALLFSAYLFLVVAPVASAKRLMFLVRRVLAYPLFLPVVLLTKDLSSLCGFFYGIWERSSNSGRFEQSLSKYMSEKVRQ